MYVNIINAFYCRPLAYQQFYSIPIYNHILDVKDCLSEAQSILKLHLKAIALDDIEVYMYIHCVLLLFIVCLRRMLHRNLIMS